MAPGPFEDPEFNGLDLKLRDLQGIVEEGMLETLASQEASVSVPPEAKVAVKEIQWAKFGGNMDTSRSMVEHEREESENCKWLRRTKSCYTGQHLYEYPVKNRL